MKHYFRLIYIFLSRHFRPRIAFTDISEVHFRVWPTDIDLLMHMNNGVYLSLMDLGRMDLTIRSGFYDILTRNGIYPVLASEAIRFKKSLQPFQSFKIRSKVWSWDEKYFFLKQEFWAKDSLYASAIIKARFLKKSGGKVSPFEIFELLGMDESEIKKQFPADKAHVKIYTDVESMLGEPSN